MKIIFNFLQRWQRQDSDLYLPHLCFAGDLLLLVYIADIRLITPYVLFLPSLIAQKIFGFIYCQHCRYICVYPSSETNRLMPDSNQRFLLPASVLAAELMSLCTQTNFNVPIYFAECPNILKNIFCFRNYRN